MRKSWKTIRLLKHGEAAYGKLTKSEDESLAQTKKVLDLLAKVSKKKIVKEGMTKEDFLKKMIESQPADPNRMMKYFFEFQARAGTKHKVEALIKEADGAVLEDDENELILYNPRNPDQAVVYDSIPNGPKLQFDGSFSSATLSRFTVLILPILVILLNIGFSVYNFGLPNSRFIPMETAMMFDKETPGKKVQNALEAMGNGKMEVAKTNFQQVIYQLEAIPKDQLSELDQENILFAYSMMMDFESGKNRYDYAQKFLQHMEAMQEHSSIFPVDDLSGLYYDLSAYALFAESFAEAEQYARKAMEQAPDMPIFMSHLPAALLFQGNLEEAAIIYREWKDKMTIREEEDQQQVLFKDLFLEDLNQLEEAGITHPDVELARDLLSR